MLFIRKTAAKRSDLLLAAVRVKMENSLYPKDYYNMVCLLFLNGLGLFY